MPKTKTFKLLSFVLISFLLASIWCVSDKRDLVKTTGKHYHPIVTKRMKIVLNETYDDSSQISLTDDITMMITRFFNFAGVKVATDKDSCDYTLSLYTIKNERGKRIDLFLKFYSPDGYLLQFSGADNLDSPVKISTTYDPPPESTGEHYVYRMKLAEAICGVIYKVFGSGPLIDALEDQTLEHRCSIIDVLSSVNEPGTEAILLDALRDKDPDVRWASLRALRSIQNTDVVIPLTIALRDTNPNVSIAAIRALGNMEDERALEPLFSVLKCNPREVSDALENINSRFYMTGEAKKQVHKCISELNDKDTTVRRKAIEVLSVLRNRNIMERLFTTLVKDENAGIREASRVALYHLDKRWWTAEKLKRIVAKYIRETGDQKAEIRLAAARALGELKEPKGTDALIILLKDKNVDVRKAAALSLSGLNDLHSVTSLCSALKDSSADVRRVAATTLGSLKDISAVKPIIPLLKDCDPGVRLAAAKAFFELRDTCAVYPLCSALKDDSRLVRIWAANALEMLKDPRAVEPLIAALKDEDPDVRRIAVATLKEIKDPRAIEPIGLLLLNDADWEVRIKATEAIRDLSYHYPRCKKLLISALKVEGGVRQTAIGALGAARESDALIPIFHILLYDKDSHIRYNAKEALDQIHQGWEKTSQVKAMIPQVISALNSKYPENRLAAVEILQMLKCPQAFESLILTLGDEDFDVRDEARHALYEIDYNWKKSQRAEHIGLKISRNLKSKNLDVRRKTAGTIGWFENFHTAEMLLALLQDNDPGVRKVAVCALGSSWEQYSMPIINLLVERDRDVIKPLSNLLRDKDPQIRKEAAHTLGITGDNRAVELLIDLLKDEDSEVREEAANSLGKLRDTLAIKPLTDALRYNNWNVLRTIACSLGELGAKETLFCTLRDKDPEIRDAALQGLNHWSFSKPECNLSPLFAALIDKNGDVRNGVENILNQIDPKWMKKKEVMDMLPEVTSAALKSKNPEFRLSAIRLLGKICNPLSFGPLVSILKDRNKSVRYTAIRALEDIYFLYSTKPLLYSLMDEYRYVRIVAVEALNKIDPQWKSSKDARKMVPDFIKALRNKNPDIRIAAAEALGMIEDPCSVRPLITLLKDDQPDVREAVARTIGILKDMRAVHPLTYLLTSEDNDAIAAAVALGQIKDPRSVEPLIAALKNPIVNMEAAQALGELKNPRALEPLHFSLEHGCANDESIIVAIGKIGGPRAIEILNHLQIDDDPYIQRYAKQALEKMNR